MKKWSDYFVRKADKGYGPPMFYVRGSRGHCLDFDGYIDGHDISDKIVYLCEQRDFPSESENIGSMGSDVEAYETHYSFLDGGFSLYSGNYRPYSETPQGSYVRGFNALRWLLTELKISQPKSLKGEICQQKKL